MANPNIVSVSSIYGGNAGWNLSTTLTATLLTVDAEKIVKINRITCANVDGSSAADITLKWTDTSASATFDLFSTASVAADNYLRFNDASIFLESGDIVIGYSGSGNSMNVINAINYANINKNLT